MKILLADDHKILIDCIKPYLNNIGDFQIVATAANGSEVVDLLSKIDVDMVILDVNMPIMDGFETVAAIMKTYPKIKVLILSMQVEPVTIKRMLDAGVSGYVLKSCGMEELLNAVKIIASGLKYFSPEITYIFLNDKPEHRVGKKVDRTHSEGFPEISKREMEVLQLIAEGLTNGQIADKLFNSKRTIESHRRNLIGKANVKNTAELVKFAIFNGILSI